MSNQIEYDFYKIANIETLSIGTVEEELRREEYAFEASERFLHSAALLPQNQFIGWEIYADENKNIRISAFSAEDIRVTSEDYNWIFQKCAQVDSKNQTLKRDFFRENRKLYILSYGLGSIETVRNAANYIKEKNRSYDYDRDDSKRYFYDLFNALMEEGAAIRIIAGDTFDGDPARGVILISLPGEMPLRIHAAITLGLPHLSAQEVCITAGTMENLKHLSDEYLIRAMSRFLETLVQKKSSTGQTDSGDNKDSGKKNKSYYMDDLEFDDDDSELWEIELRGTSYEDNDKKDQSMPRKTPTYLERLEELIGLDNVKAQVKRIAAFAKMKKDMCTNDKSVPSLALNMAFVGNPGTAKTTVARIIAGIFYETGILPSNKMIEAGRADLVANYVGQTATKVRKLFRRARGKLLFIDEAYSLVENRRADFGYEAINTLVQEMENNRSNTIVIFAGYPNEMRELFDINPGMRSRVPFTLQFNDYSSEELVRIAEIEARTRGFSLALTAKERVWEICNNAAGHSSKGNGRFCRNLVENAILEYAERIYGNNLNDTSMENLPQNDWILIDKDFSFPEDIQPEKKKEIIGFRQNIFEESQKPYLQAVNLCGNVLTEATKDGTLIKRS